MNDGTQITLNGIPIEPKDRLLSPPIERSTNTDPPIPEWQWRWQDNGGATETEFEMETVNGIYMFLS